MQCHDGSWENLDISSTPSHIDTRFILQELNNRLDKAIAVPAHLISSKVKCEVNNIEQDFITCIQKAEEKINTYHVLTGYNQSLFAEVLAKCQFECKWVDLIHAEFEGHLSNLCLEHGQLSRNIRKRTASTFQQLISLLFSALDISNSNLNGEQKIYQARAAPGNKFTREVSEGLQSSIEEGKSDCTQFEAKENIQAEYIDDHNSDHEQLNAALNHVHDLYKRDKNNSKSGELYDRIQHLERELTDARRSIDEITRSADRKLANLDELLSRERETVKALQLQVNELITRPKYDSLTSTEAPSNSKQGSLDSSEIIQRGSPQKESDTRNDDFNERSDKENHDVHQDIPSFIKPSLVSRRRATCRDNRCSAFRILLPNFGGERPIRSDAWIRCCMRAMLFAKAFDDRQRACQTRFPDFVYAFFNQAANGDSSGSVVKAYEDCWGFYDGIFRLLSSGAHTSVEGHLFINYLSEEHGRDYNRFALHAVDILCSYVDIGTSPTANCVAQIDEMCHHENIPKAYMHKKLYVEVQHIMKASSLILSQLDASTRQEINQRIRSLSREATLEEGQNNLKGEKVIDMFDWLQLIMNLFLQEQSLRRAALRLMFETCQIGILTSDQIDPSNVGVEMMQNDKDHRNIPNNAPPGFVDLSQFTAIVHTIQPDMGLTEIASFYRRAHEASGGQISFKIFLAIGEEIDFFSSSLRLPRTVDATFSDRLPPRTSYHIGASCHLHLQLVQPILQSIGSKMPAGSRQRLLQLEGDLRFALEVATKGLAIDGMSPLAAYRRLMLFVLNARVELCEGSREQEDPAWAALYAEREMDALELVAFGMKPSKEYRKVSAMKHTFAQQKIHAAILKWHRRPCRRPSWLKSIERNKRETRRLSMNIRNLVGMESLTEGDA